MRKAVDYANTDISIYKIVSITNPLLNVKHIGFTANFTKMKQTHKQRSLNPDNTYLPHIYETINNNGGFTNFRLIEIEKKRFKDKREVEHYCFELLKTL